MLLFFLTAGILFLVLQPVIAFIAPTPPRLLAFRRIVRRRETTTSKTRMRLDANTPKSNLFLDWYGNLLRPRVDSNLKERRKSLLDDLVRAECAAPNNKPSRAAVEERIEQLAPLSPVTATAASAPQLQKRWKLIYTTEKEINFFLDAGLSNEIYQTIHGSRLENSIPFVKGGGSFTVTGSLSVPDPQGVRTNFVFETAVLDLGSWGCYTLPPVGKGWFDTVYLDDEYRIDRNSRNDILICVVAAADDDKQG